MSNIKATINIKKFDKFCYAEDFEIVCLHPVGEPTSGFINLCLGKDGEYNFSSPCSRIKIEFVDPKDLLKKAIIAKVRRKIQVGRATKVEINNIRQQLMNGDDDSIFVNVTCYPKNCKRSKMEDLEFPWQENLLDALNKLIEYSGISLKRRF